MILVTLSTPTDAVIPWKYPSKYFRALLSSPIWLPIATLSYSIYLWHYIFIMTISDQWYSNPDDSNFLEWGSNEGMMKKECPKFLEEGYTDAKYLFAAGTGVSIVVATFSYVFVEKPAIDARIVFKSKW